MGGNGSGQIKDPELQCTATSKQTGEQCKRPKQHGTEVCRFHGAGGPNSERGLRRKYQRQAQTYGEPVDIDPHNALLEEVRRTAGHVEWLGMVVSDLEQEQLTRGHTKTIQMPDGGRRVEAETAINVWIKLYQQERDRLVRVSKQAIDANIEEKLVKIEEHKAQTLASVVRNIVEDLGHNMADENVRDTVRARLVEANAA